MDSSLFSPEHTSSGILIFTVLIIILFILVMGFISYLTRPPVAPSTLVEIPIYSR